MTVKNTPHSALLPVVTLAAVALLSACGGGGGGGDSAPSGGNPSTGGGNVVVPTPNPVIPPPALGDAMAFSNDAAESFTYAALDGFNGDSSAAAVATGDVNVQKIEFGQINLKTADSPYFALAANRDVLIRVAVSGSVANLKAPKLKVTITKDKDGSEVFSQVVSARDGQRVLPVEIDKAPIYYAAYTTRDYVDNGSNVGVYKDRSQPATEIKSTSLPDLNRSYLVRWPAGQVLAEKLTVKAEIVTGTVLDSNSANDVKTAQLEPHITQPLNIALVPIQVAGTLPKMPSDEFIRTELMKYFPVPAVNIRHRDPWVPNPNILGVGVTVDAYPKRGQQAIMDLMSGDLPGSFTRLPQDDGVEVKLADDVDHNYMGSLSKEYYLGLVRSDTAGGITSSLSTSSIIADSQFAISKALSNETWNGPAQSDDVAVCGSVVQTTKLYPYTGGRMGGVWGIDLVSEAGKIKLINPSLHFDLAGYCNPIWTSDYSVKKWMRDFKLGELNHKNEWQLSKQVIDPFKWW
ncbi:hypothetical protein [Iodobacter fluviatilis]|uniref:Lipoprotein n=1 Tax=Iodobacter fluviatilis TaxID=537 RepID=A0A377Q487_9NEIS|nr:hypothetical protein [Iodobacter fluviatilis]TCU84620.1 hypothetical protein EV682_109145 [Iodobacter fluviatilis]STQ90086.1 Uncharacterised protein [Iodobacter fluviatilis]